MSEQTPRHEMTKKRVVYAVPGMETVPVRRDVAYRQTDAGALTMDIYNPPDAANGARPPVVLFAPGYSDVGMRKILGCRLKEMESYISWAQLTALSGMAAVTFSAVEPVSDTQALLQHLHQHAEDLGLDVNRMGLWAASGNVPNALSLLMRAGEDRPKCAVFCYGCMPDLDGATAMAEAAATWGFVNPVAGKSVADLPPDVPLFLARAVFDACPSGKSARSLRQPPDGAARIRRDGRQRDLAPNHPANSGIPAASLVGMRLLFQQRAIHEGT
jgi:hypothetical protein